MHICLTVIDYQIEKIKITSHYKMMTHQTIISI